MAFGGTNVYIYNKTGTDYVLTNSGNNNIFISNDTINALLLNYTNAGIKSVSLSLGGTAIPGEQTASVRGVGEGITYLYDVTEPETITGFFLDGQEYKIGGDEDVWGNISGTLSDQTDLQTALNAKANDSDVVKTSGNQTVAGTKTFSTSPVVPSKTADAANTGTAIATEAQVYKKQDKLTTQTAYTSKGSATKVPQITTNTLGQVTGITEVDIQAGETYNAGEGISIGDVSMNARKGPSPDGFHVPSTTEWQGVKTIMDGLQLTTGSIWRINLHMPFAGGRIYSDASLYDQGSYGRYWSSSPDSASSSNARRLYLSSSYVDATNLNDRAYGFSVRCFKDSYVAADSSWTVIQGTLGSAGIFWNQSEGLISITNGTTGYTIMDKNLGATTVYNDGDTLTQANMGNMYQWGNNYGFPSTGTISNTSSTKVDASAYGPTNPYSSDTFITGNSDWSSVKNDDLWGDTSGIYTLENVITNTGVLSVNGQTGDVTVSSGAEIVYATQDEYDALPSSKLTDGKHYFIYEGGGGVTLKTYEEIVTMATDEGEPRTNTRAELNSHPDEYIQYLDSEGQIGWTVQGSQGWIHGIGTDVTTLYNGGDWIIYKNGGFCYLKKKHGEVVTEDCS